jgi:DNA (cytosine-5)-methyltransferase 1
VTVKDTLWEDGHPAFGPLDYKRAVLWVKNVVRPHAEAVTWSLDRPSPTVGAHQAAKLALAPEGVPEEQLARQQWHTKGRRQRDLPPVDVEHNMLSDEELLLLQTFPRSWYLSGTRMQRAFQIGNAVPPQLACALGKALLGVNRHTHSEIFENAESEDALDCETVAA